MIGPSDPVRIACSLFCACADRGIFGGMDAGPHCGCLPPRAPLYDSLGSLSMIHRVEPRMYNGAALHDLAVLRVAGMRLKHMSVLYSSKDDERRFT